MSFATCVVSTRYEFIFVGLPKVASSTLRSEFRETPHYEGVELIYQDIPEEQRQNFFTFTALRDPVTRLLSAYQEVNLRYDDNPAPYPEFGFWQLPDDMSRFAAFLTVIEHQKFDNHLWEQTRYLNSVVRIDAYVRQECLQSDLAQIADRIGFDSNRALPFRRSRQSRIEQYQYNSYNLSPDQLSEEQIAKIRELYAEDVALYQSVFEAVESRA